MLHVSVSNVIFILIYNCIANQEVLHILPVDYFVIHILGRSIRKI